MRTDPIHAARLLDWCYNTQPGMWLTRALLSRRAVSIAYGWYCRRKWTRRRIVPFARAMGVDLSEIIEPLDSFGSFSEFFCRSIDLTRRPIDPDPTRLISPVDGRLFVLSGCDKNTPLVIKGGLFDMARLLSNSTLACRFDGGTIVTSRLYLNDYHHFHFPDSGVAQKPQSIPGRYFAVSPYAREWKVPFCSENHRVVTLLDSDHFGTIAIVEIGAFTVGSIRQCFCPGVHVTKGERKGLFELGGSLVVLVFERGAVQIDDDLHNNSQAGIETLVRMGEGIGRPIQSRRVGC